MTKWFGTHFTVQVIWYGNVASRLEVELINGVCSLDIVTGVEARVRQISDDVTGDDGSETSDDT